MSRKNGKKRSVIRRVYTAEFKQEAVQMLLDGHSARVGVRSAGSVRDQPVVLLEEEYSWKRRRDCVESGRTCSRVGNGTAACRARA